MENEIIKRFREFYVKKFISPGYYDFVKACESDLVKSIEKFFLSELKALKKESYKKGFNDCLKEQCLTGEKYQHLYL